jgi:hypothetical protein
MSPVCLFYESIVRWRVITVYFDFRNERLPLVIAECTTPATTTAPHSAASALAPRQRRVRHIQRHNWRAQPITDSYRQFRIPE